MSLPIPCVVEYFYFWPLITCFVSAMFTYNQKTFLYFFLLLSFFGIAIVLLASIPIPAVTVTNASLTQFNLNRDNNTLYYNLALDVALKNPSPTFRLHYKRIEVTAKYREERFALATLAPPPLNQGTKITTILHPVLQGQSFVMFSAHDLSEFNLETTAGVYIIDLQVAILLSRKNQKGFVYRGMCKLKVGSSFNQTSTASKFQGLQNVCCAQ